MRGKYLFLCILLVNACIAAGGAAGVTSASVTDPQQAAASVYVSSYDVSPEVFYPYETGTVTVSVTNPTNLTVGLSQADLIGPHVKIINTNDFNTMTNLGPGTTTTFSFVVRVDSQEGDTFPLFTVAPKTAGANPVHGQVKVKVDSTDIRASIAKKPDTFSLSKKDTVNVSVINPRDGEISDILIVPEGFGNEVTPSEGYVSTLPASSSVQVPFDVTPSTGGNVTFHVSFNNGDNKHTMDVVLPLNLGTDKTAVIPVVNNIEVTSAGSYYHLTGDVNNAGISDAKSMVVTVGEPARAVQPYAEYSIGTLASDDFSSFEVTFVARDLTAVPVVVEWKDADGNSFNATDVLDLSATSSSGTGSRTGNGGGSGSGSSATGSAASRSFSGPGGGGGSVFGFGGSRGSGLSAFYPVIAGAIVLIVAVVLWLKRKWILSKLKKK